MALARLPMLFCIAQSGDMLVTARYDQVPEPLKQFLFKSPERHHVWTQMPLDGTDIDDIVA